MNRDKLPSSLAPSTRDYVVSAVKSIVGAVPFAGSLLVEIAGTVIPRQRIDRLALFARELEERLNSVDQAAVRAHLADENFTDLMGEGLRQAARSTTDDRRRHIANVIAGSLASEDISFVESKHILRLLGEINDIEVIWLRFHLNQVMQGDEDFRAKHDEVLAPVMATMASPQSEIDKDTLQQSYKEHLEQLGLLRERHRVDRQTKMPEFDRNGRPTVESYELTRLGRLLLLQLGFQDPYGSG